MRPEYVSEGDARKCSEEKFTQWDKQYRFDGFTRSDLALDTMQLPLKMQQRGGFMLHVSTVCATVIYITDANSLGDTRKLFHVFDHNMLYSNSLIALFFSA